MSDLVVVATVMQTPDRETLEVLHDAAVVVRDGAITAVLGPADPGRAEALAAATEVVAIEPPAVLVPGLVDVHLHASQWPQLGSALDIPLEEWLFQHTFPLEARFADVDFAVGVWESLVSGLLSEGTTTAVMFATVHEEATVELARVCGDLGLRADVGRVAMDLPDGTPEWYRDASPSASVEASHRSIQAIEALGGGRSLVRPIITPRFVPSCTDAALTGLGELAEATGVSIQTHCSESDWAHGYVLDRFGLSDARVLDRFGLLREHTVVAHGVQLGTDDLDLLRERGAGIAHCPLSNAYFADSALPVREALDRGVGIGLGSDVAGGFDASMLRQCATAVTSSRMLESGVDPAVAPTSRGRADARIDTTAAFWMATLGGAELLGLPVGLLEPGRRFDAVVLDPTSPGSSITEWPDLDDDARRFERFVRLAGRADVARVWVDGRAVVGDHATLQSR
ncbi:MAG: amidohydrolase family protein [Actinomycetota bacterium]